MAPEKELKLEHNNMHGWFLRLTKKDETRARKKLSASYQVLEAKKDGTKFTNKKLRALSQKRVDLDKSYETQQKHLVEPRSGRRGFVLGCFSASQRDLRGDRRVGVLRRGGDDGADPVCAPHDVRVGRFR